MSSCLVRASKPFRPVFVLVLTSLLLAWTRTAIVGFNSCPDAVPQPQITALSPNVISADAASVLLTVDGSNFVGNWRADFSGFSGIRFYYRLLHQREFRNTGSGR
jgi:hypothetical protein